MDPKLSKMIGAKNRSAHGSSNDSRRTKGTGIKWSDIKRGWELLKETYAKWSADKAPRLGAALSYYTVFSLAPLLVLTISIAGLVFGVEAAQRSIMAQIESLVGPQSAADIQQMLEIAQKPSHGMVAGLIAIGTLLIGASGVFAQLQLPGHEGVLQEANFIVSLGVITLLFAMMFKLLPDARIGWRDVWLGAGLTSVLFTIGKFLIGMYLGKAEIGSAYGAAGSLVILLVWVYYSSQILLYGAEFTAVYANRYGSHIIPDTNAAAA